MSYIRGRLYNRTKKHQGGTGANQFKQSGQSVQSAAAATLAAKHGVSEKTIRRDGKRAEAIDKLAKTKPDTTPKPPAHDTHTAHRQPVSPVLGIQMRHRPS